MIDAIAALAPFPMSDALKRTLVDAYATPPRAYHTLEHILDVARHFALLTWQQPRDVFGAVLFHDAIYDVSRRDNERRSAELAKAQGESARTQQLILLTANHAAPPDSDAAQFLDCDMAILSAERDAFTLYSQQIALEYVPVVGEDAYRLGRRRFLESLLARPRIFFTPHFDEARARSNIKSAL